MAATYNGIPLFLEVEQGSGYNSKNAYVYFKPSMATEAKEWIKKNFGKTFKIKGKEDYETSLPMVTAEEQDYRNELNDYIVDRLEVITIEDTKNTPKLYTDALKGNENTDSTAMNQDD